MVFVVFYSLSDPYSLFYVRHPVKWSYGTALIQYINFPDLFNTAIIFLLLSVSFIVFIRTRLTSVADPGCLSLNLIFVHPQSRIPNPGSRIPDPKTATKKEG
jgi:hypothetical protein